MKKIFSLVLACAMSCTLFATAFAELQVGTTNPTVRVDDRELIFDDQKAIIDISANRTLVPVRGVFEAMGARVTWVADKSKVIIIAKDNLKRVELYINNPVMTVYKATSLLTSEKSEVTLETVPVIYNNRTMMPLRAICEAMDATVDWYGETHTIDVHSKAYNKYIAQKTEENGDGYSLKDDAVNMTITVDKTEVQAGDTVNILVNVSNTAAYADTELCGGMITMKYNMDNFDYVGAELLQDGEVRTDVEVTPNETFQGDSVRVLFLVVGTPEDRGPKAADTAVYRLTFKAKNDNGGEFALTDRTNGKGLIDCNLLYDHIDDIYSLDEYDALHIDTTPVVVK